eukprot:scaffold66298_cov63-Phaeocystis_antarctica.AAC.1
MRCTRSISCYPTNCVDLPLTRSTRWRLGGGPHTLTGGLYLHTHSPVEGAYLRGFGLLMATGFLWLARGPTAVARAAGVVRPNGGILAQRLLPNGHCEYQYSALNISKVTCGGSETERNLVEPSLQPAWYLHSEQTLG